MSPKEIQKLLGGYATDTLSAAERSALFAAALEDQELFDALAKEHALREVLEDPASRQQLIAALGPSRDTLAARSFQLGVDAACVYVNASTRFTDGGEFGMGAEIGNSTQKLHARGPIGLRELCSSKYLIEGDGHVRG